MIPETQIADWESTLTMGYAQTKLICERIIERAAADYPQTGVGFKHAGRIAGCLTNKRLQA